MSLTQAERNAIIEAALNKTKDEFAAEVASRTKLTQDEVLKLAKTKEERETLAQTLAEVSKATTSNTARANAIRNIAGGVEALVKIMDLVL